MIYDFVAILNLYRAAESSVQVRCRLAMATVWFELSEPPGSLLLINSVGPLHDIIAKAGNRNNM